MSLRTCRAALVAVSLSCSRPAPIQIAVEVDGKAAAPLDSALLAAKAPDVVERGRAVWKLATLFPELVKPGVVVETEDDQGLKSVVGHPGEDAAKLEYVLEKSESGDIRVMLVVKGAPLPPPRETGANRGTGDDRRARMPKVLRLLARAPSPESGPSIEYVVDDAAPKTASLSRETMKPFSVLSEDGEGLRDAWPLHEIAVVLGGGKDAVVVEVVSRQGETAAVDAAAWSDPSKVPVLRANKHGKLKFQWLTPKGDRITDAVDLKDIGRVRISTRGKGG